MLELFIDADVAIEGFETLKHRKVQPLFGNALDDSSELDALANFIKGVAKNEFVNVYIKSAWTEHQIYSKAFLESEYVRALSPYCERITLVDDSDEDSIVWVNDEGECFNWVNAILYCQNSDIRYIVIISKFDDEFYRICGDSNECKSFIDIESFLH